MKKLIVVGCNPTPNSKDPKVPFVGTRSFAILEGWLERLGVRVENVEFINLSEKVTKQQSDLRLKEIDVDSFRFRMGMAMMRTVFETEEEAFEAMLAVYQKNNKLDPKWIVPLPEEKLVGYIRKINSSKAPKVVALGQIASWGLRKIGVEHALMPHPSGLNRKLNDPKYVSQVLRECRRYITDFPITSKILVRRKDAKERE